MDVEWALEQLRNYLHLKERVPLPKEEQSHNRKTRARGSAEELRNAELIVEAISRAVYEGSRFYVNPALAERLVWELTQGDSVREKLGLDAPPAPTINAHGLHPWVWDAAMPHWQSGNHRAALWAASINVNSRTQRKVARPEIGESKLLQEVFGITDPAPGRPRLRLTDKSNPDHFKDVHLGASALGQGLYSAVRNPINHIAEEDHDMSEAEALEALAGFSLLARWIDRAEVVSVDKSPSSNPGSVESHSPLLPPR
ncbi:TIGR02391 family protein [Microbacterium sp. B2969]|uniref:TIGR02391 family protein n=1 Tax=Microbacterium alkaliflavum TaxID=3248839 RepID=A0ABW7Q7J3_9MICO